MKPYIPPPFIAIDPGLNVSGWAYFKMGGRLDSCGLMRSKSDQWLIRCFEQITSLPIDRFVVTAMVFEKPEVYNKRVWKGDPNDLIDLSIHLGLLAACFPNAVGALHLPKQWKGQVPKSIHHKRIKKTLEPEERAKLPTHDAATGRKLPESLLHNMMDAVGIGLYHLGR